MPTRAANVLFSGPGLLGPGFLGLLALTANIAHGADIAASVPAAQDRATVQAPSRIAPPSSFPSSVSLLPLRANDTAIGTAIGRTTMLVRM